MKSIKKSMEDAGIRGGKRKKESNALGNYTLTMKNQ